MICRELAGWFNKKGLTRDVGVPTEIPRMKLICRQSRGFLRSTSLRFSELFSWVEVKPGYGERSGLCYGAFVGPGLVVRRGQDFREQALFQGAWPFGLCLLARVPACLRRSSHAPIQEHGSHQERQPPRE